MFAMWVASQAKKMSAKKKGERKGREKGERERGEEHGEKLEKRAAKAWKIWSNMHKWNLKKQRRQSSGGVNKVRNGSRSDEIVERVPTQMSAGRL